MDGVLYSENYRVLTATNFDPIEKKPLYHFFPGSTILSIGSLGCNLKCKCCQNWQISQSSADNFPYTKSYSPGEIVQIAKSRSNNIGVAFTYNEPTVWFEYMFETSKLINTGGMKNVMVSNGYINEAPLKELVKYIDAFNIDLKAFNEKFYKIQASARLEPVKQTLQVLVKHNKHLEITNLVIPTLNDDETEFEEMVNWIAKELGRDTVLHLSRYHPMYKLDLSPTRTQTLDDYYHIASKKLNHVYVGNITLKDYQDTKCPKCGKTVIRRSGYFTEANGIDAAGKCANCSEQIAVRT